MNHSTICKKQVLPPHLPSLRTSKGEAWKQLSALSVCPYEQFPCLHWRYLQFSLTGILLQQNLTRRDQQVSKLHIHQHSKWQWKLTLWRQLLGQIDGFFIAIKQSSTHFKARSEEIKNITTEHEVGRWTNETESSYLLNSQSSCNFQRLQESSGRWDIKEGSFVCRSVPPTQVLLGGLVLWCHTKT